MPNATYYVCSSEIADLLVPQEDLAVQDDPQAVVERAAETYAQALRDAFCNAGLDIAVEVHHRVVGCRTYDGDLSAGQIDRLKAVADATMADMATLEDIQAAMADHERRMAPNSESAQWGAFVEAARQATGVLGYDEDLGPVTVVPPDFAAFWYAVAEGDYERAAQYGEVPSEWQASSANA